jgi:hypothetical protein
MPKHDMDSSLTDTRIADLLFEMCARGIKVRAENNQLHYFAEPGAFTTADRTALLLHKKRIVSFLERSTVLDPISAPLLPRRSSLNVVPLLPFQQWHWHISSGTSGGRSTIAIRINKIDVTAMRRTFQDLCGRHESLRTRVVFVSGEPRLEILETPRTVLQPIALTCTSVPERETEARGIIESLASESIDLSRDLLFDAKLIEVGDQDSILVVRAHSLIFDAASWTILWRDIGLIYTSHVRGSAVPLPKILQPGDLAVWHEQSESRWARKHSSYWQNRLSGTERIDLFPTNGGGLLRSTPTAFTVAVQNVCTALCAFAQQRKTSLGMVVLTIWIASIMRWCRRSDVVVSYLTTGRFHADLENSIGLFMCQLFLRIQLQKTDTLDGLLTNVVEEYDRAYQNHDFGRVIARDQNANFALNPNFYWVPKFFSLSPAEALKKAISGASVRPFDFTPPALCNIDWSREDLGFALRQSDDDIRGAMFGPTFIARERFERFSGNLQVFASTLIRTPHVHVTEVPCCADPVRTDLR